MDFDHALSYLDTHTSYTKTGRIDSPTVENIAGLCAAMADPQHAQPVIHVTGTNGKGSTVQMITGLLMAHGLTVGTYTSPHLEHITGRIRRNGEPISPDEFGEQVAGIAAVEELTGIRPTYFEAVTAAAFRWFADVAVDVAVIEVGMLGRWDATNVVNAQVAVVTNIALDHTEFAGPALVDIAREKAGIIKPNSAAVIGETRPELVDIFRQEGGASTLVRGDDFDVVDNSLAVGGRSLDLRTPTSVYTDVFLPVHGAYQGENAAIALTAAETFFAAPLDDEMVREGLGSVEIPGRFETLGVQPLVVLDGAHNPAGADTCASVFFDDFQPEGRRILVVGTLRDTDEMVAALRADEFDVVHTCTAPSPRGRTGVEMARAARELGCEEIYVHDSVEEACIAALRQADADDAILVAGSLYVAGAARPVLTRLIG
ncbi:MAG: bifunctional folylpolyglutamate synthase/dihydrofolate synthase [Ilumatobacter coccineus]|uniref:tetrahydrofolate synthase n=1 Tax=Ilumatobacter coccineus TaxID=467094 RepID=A0A2G6K993_9ACTN|nr:MAG: bifunctional folylpolyglutamate synthase/dihydrofolate synthase [Ilumatobacter coccineus]